jgi:hypothetical protein
VIIRAVDEWLTYKGIIHYRINTGALKSPGGRLVRFGSPGMSDFYAVKNGKSVWIECKRPAGAGKRGGVLSAAQQEFLDCMNENGVLGIVVDGVESLDRQLREAGVVA